jgi:hypothetical protein
MKIDSISFSRNSFDSFGRKTIWLKNDRNRYQNSIFQHSGPLSRFFLDVMAPWAGIYYLYIFIGQSGPFERNDPSDRSFSNVMTLQARPPAT